VKRTLASKPGPAPARSPIFPNPSSRHALHAICFGFFLVLLDTTALNVAMVPMEHQLGEGISGLQWVVNGYTLVFASFLLTAGAVGDRVGAKRVYQAGLALFTGMSLVSALAPTAGWLIGARVLQGLGAAFMLPGSLSLLSHAFPEPEQRARAVGFWAGVVSLGFAAGPVLGGILTHCFGWRSIFWLNVPVGVLALRMNHRFVTEARVDQPRRIDWRGQTFILLALFTLNFGLIQAGPAGWTSPMTLGALALTIGLGLAFLYTEKRSVSPVLPPALLANRTFSVCILIGAALNFTMYGTLFIESLHLQNGRHFGALRTGLTIIPFTILPTVTTRLVARYNGRQFIKARLVCGQLLVVAGLIFLALALDENGIALTLTGLGLMGVAMGLIMPAMTAGVLAAAPPAMSGLAAGLLNSSRQVGGMLGVALMGALVATNGLRGMVWSFGLTVAALLVMTVIIQRFVRSGDTPATPLLLGETIPGE